MLSVSKQGSYVNTLSFREADFKPNPKRKFTALEKSRKRANQNLEMGRVLGEIAKARRDGSAEVTADLLKLSGYAKANGELTNFIDKKGRAFNCPQALISASTRLDTNYQIKTARRHRKRIMEAFASRLDEVKEHKLSVSFLTPTFPNLLGIGFADNDRFQAKAWELFLQMQIFGEFFYAGFSKTEWTIAEGFDLYKDGINYHSHVLCINHKPFAEGVTPDLENKLAFMNKDKRYTAEDKRLLRNSLRIVSAWTNCLQKAHRELFGKPLKVKTNSGRVRFTFQNVNISEIKSYDIDEARNGIFWEIAKTANYTAKGNSYKGLTPELLLEAENVFSGKRLINSFGVFRKQVERTSETSPNLVKQLTKQSENYTEQTPNSLYDNVLRGENEPLKSYGIRLCEQGLRDTWLRYLEVNKDLIISKRRDALLERFPNSVFTDLTGQSYYGWQAVKSLKQKEKELRADYNPASDNYYLFKQYQKAYYSDTTH